MDVMVEKYLPFGYEYFVMDAGWYSPMNPEKHQGLELESFGVCVVRQAYFPNGIKVLTDYAHKKGLKFGVWLMRGIPRQAVEENLPIPGTPYFARDIADTNSVCVWSRSNYGVDMTKPGAQPYCNVVINALAGLGIDSIKVDDMVPNPREIVAIARATEEGRFEGQIIPVQVTLEDGSTELVTRDEGIRWDTSLEKLASLPVIPLVSGGRQLLQPVHIDDVVELVLACLTAAHTRITLDVVGEKPVSFREWLDIIRRTAGRCEARVLPVPYALCLAFSYISRYFSPLLQPDNLRMLQAGNTADPAPVAAILGRMPEDIETGWKRR